jgi:hypothetical protein
MQEARSTVGNAGVSNSTPMLKLNITDVEDLTLFKLISKADAKPAV